MGLALQPFFYGTTLDLSSFGKGKRLFFARKVYPRFLFKVNINVPHHGKQIVPVIKAVATFEPKYLVQSENAVVQDYELQICSNSNSQNFVSQSEEPSEMDERERYRRMKISKAKKGKVPWNKGRKHSAATIQRIRERTKLAMQDPKVKMKLANLGHPQSEATRVKIGVGVRIGWQRHRKLLMIQETCYLEWQNLIAEASRKGYAGEDGLQWDSYVILDKQLEKEWLESIEKRKTMERPKVGKRAPKSPEQRKKISEAISAKWADPEYHARVCSALAKYHGTPIGAERKSRKKPMGGISTSQKKAVKGNAIRQYKSVETESKHLGNTGPGQIRNATLAFKDPQADSKLEIIKKIREQRAATGTKKRESTKRAKLLIAKAEEAAKALEAVAVKSSLARASLLETRKLIAEATQWIESIGRGESMTSNIGKGTSLISKGSAIQLDRNPDAALILKTEAGGTNVLSSSNGDYGVFGQDTFASNNLMNRKEPLSIPHNSERMSGECIVDCVLPPQLHSPIKHPQTIHLGGNRPIPNGASKCKRMPPKDEKVGEEMRMKDESPPSVTRFTKKWVCGRLVEVTEEENVSHKQ